LVPLQAKERTIDAALSNSFGFGGTNASVIFKKAS
jgi:3-oxoacyl-[acyl-carrier-protein] synthase II